MNENYSDILIRNKERISSLEEISTDITNFIQNLCQQIAETDENYARIIDGLNDEIDSFIKEMDKKLDTFATGLLDDYSKYVKHVKQDVSRDNLNIRNGRSAERYKFFKATDIVGIKAALRSFGENLKTTGIKTTFQEVVFKDYFGIDAFGDILDDINIQSILRYQFNTNNPNERDFIMLQNQVSRLDAIQKDKTLAYDFIRQYAAMIGVNADMFMAIALKETGGNFFYPDGSLNIRFENHILYQNLDGIDPSFFNQYISQASNWQNHQINVKGSWQRIHPADGPAINTNSLEYAKLQYQAYILAKKACYENNVSDSAVYSAMSYGGFQVLGASSGESRYNACSSGVEAQVRITKEYLENKGGGILDTMQNEGDELDFKKFGRIYQGSNSDDYGNEMEQRYNDWINGRYEELRSEGEEEQ